MQTIEPKRYAGSSYCCCIAIPWSIRKPLTSILPLTEIARNSSVLVRMDGNQTVLTKKFTDDRAAREEDSKAFTFDRSFWSVDPNDYNFAGQETVYKDLGEDLMGHAFDGYNCCIFACEYSEVGAGCRSLKRVCMLIRFGFQMVKLDPANPTLWYG